MSEATRVGQPNEAAGEEPTELKRVMGPKLLLLFIVGDILGTGIYALTGQVANEVGGAVWAPFLVAFVIAIITAFSYLELVTKYPRAGGAATFVHRAFSIHFITFIITFTVMCSGITSASTASRAFAENLFKGINVSTYLEEGVEKVQPGTILIGAFAFILLVMAVNFRGVAESVKTNVVLTLIELTGLLLVIFVGIYAVLGFSDVEVEWSRITVFDSGGEKSAFMAVTAATAIAFFAMVGFEDSVNMAEETKEPSKVFPKIMLSGLLITGVIYLLVSITAVALVPVGDLAGAGSTPLLLVVERGAPGLPIGDFYPFMAMFAVANSALINMMMASRLLYGMARQNVLPRPLGLVHKARQTPWVAIIFTTVLALGLITLVPSVSNLGTVTAFLLLAVFAVVNVACLVLRRDPVDHEHFRAPTALPVLGALTCLFMVGPWVSRPTEVYQVAGWLMVIGVVLWALTWFLNRALYASPTRIKEPSEMDSHGGPVN